MTQFHYRALTPTGDNRSGVIEAADREDAAAVLIARGDTPVEIRPRRLLLGLQGTRGLSKADLATFMNDLAALHDAGVPLRKALELLARNETSKQMRDMAVLMIDRLDAGSDLARAAKLDEADDLVLASELAKAGEVAGRLSQTLRVGAGILERQSEFAKALRSAFAYPAFLLVLAIGAIIALAVFAGPSLAPLMEEAGTQGGGLGALIAIGEFLRSHGLSVLAALTLTLALINHFGRRPPLNAAFASWRARLPLIGPIVRDVSCGAFARTFGALISGGTPAARALELAAASAPNLFWKTRLKDAASALREGRTISNALATIPNAPSELIHLARVGEEAGALGEMSFRAGDLILERALRRLDALASIAGPALLVIMGLLIASIMSAFLTGLTSLGDVGL